jgi:hypothetical protein
MVEIMKHVFGVCGEPHPSLLWLITSGGVLVYFIKKNVKWCFGKLQILKKYLMIFK